MKSPLKSIRKALILLSFIFSAGFVAVAQPIQLEIKENTPPKTWSEINLSSAFSNPNTATTDLYSKNGHRDVGIPNNYMGSQDAADGNSNYIGIIAYYGDFTKPDKKGNWKARGYDKWSEYAYAALPSALRAGAEYKVTFKVSLADKAKFAVSGLGAFFSSTPLANTTVARLSNEPQVSKSEVIKDKNGWTEITGNFTAKGDEKYVAVGAFDKNFKYEPVAEYWNNGYPRAYYYISGIKVEEAVVVDTDKDGIPDFRDKCPTEKGIEKFEGCPDTDGDGIKDADDKCPTLAGLEQFGGCPDTDGDSIIDPEDKCPTIAGVVSNGGCPEITEKTKELLSKSMTGIQFESGKDVIRKMSYGILNNVVDVMKKNPDYKLKIDGHTDSQGKEDMNQGLSERRAASVKNYLVSKGIDSGRLRTEGFGEMRPVADNNTAAGRYKNRRVEFTIEFNQ